MTKCEGFWFIFHLELFAHSLGLCLHNEWSDFIVSCALGLVSGARSGLPSLNLMLQAGFLRVVLQVEAELGLLFLYLNLNAELMITSSSPADCSTTLTYALLT